MGGAARAGAAAVSAATATATSERDQERGPPHAPTLPPLDAPLLPEVSALTFRCALARERPDASSASTRTRFPRFASVTLNGELRAASRATRLPSRLNA